MWQTIQILLGPEEHAQFLREAVEKWDVKDVETGDIFPKILPRECFPKEPDRHMVAWYEGVSERLRKEAEAEEEAKFDAREDSEDEGRPRRLRGSRVEDVETDEESVDSRAPALAYFRNPLYRHVDGRPSIVRRSSKRPGLSPRQTMMEKGKEAVGSIGRIARNVGSPHLWDGRGHSRSGSANTAGGSKRRQSHSHLHHSTSPPDDAPPTSSGSDRRDHSHSHPHRRRTGSSQLEVPPQQLRPQSAVSSSAAADDEWWEHSEPGSPQKVHHNSPPGAAAGAGAGLAAAAAARHGSGHSRSHSQHGPHREPAGKDHRRHRSAEPTPSGPPGGGSGEPDDYFGGTRHDAGPGVSHKARRDSEEKRNGKEDSDSDDGDGDDGGEDDDEDGAPPHRRGSTTPPPVPAENGVGVSFGPSAGPLFASHVARQTSVAGRGGGGGGGGRGDGGSRASPEVMQHRPRHHHHDPRRDDPRRDDSRRGSSRRGEDERRRHADHDGGRFDSPRRSGRGGGGGPGGYDGNQNMRFDDPYRGEGRRGSRDVGGGRGEGGGRGNGGRGDRRYPPPEDEYDDEPPPPRRSREDVGRSRKQTRFAGDGAGERGVSGRRYPDGSPWGRE